MNTINHYETLINSRIDDAMFLNNAFDNSELCTNTLTFDEDKYVIPHWMRAEIIATIIKENGLDHLDFSILIEVDSKRMLDKVNEDYFYVTPENREKKPEYGDEVIVNIDGIRFVYRVKEEDDQNS